MEEKMFKYSEEKNQNDAVLDKAIQDYNLTPIERQATIFDRNISNITNDTVFMGSGLKSELAEIERHVTKMIKEGMYSYQYIQKFLESVGYQNSKIKEIFRKITGINPNDIMDPKEYYDSPACIPGLTHAWGQAKKSKYDFYFINAYNNGYAVFGQKGDLQRDIVETFLSLKQALASLKKLVKTIFSYDKVIDEDILLSDKETERTELSGDSHTTVTASDEPITFYRKAFIQGQISEETFDSKLSNLLVEGHVMENEVIQAMEWKENYKTAKYEQGLIKVIADMKIKRMFNGEEVEYSIEPIYDLDNDTIVSYNVYENGTKLHNIKNDSQDGRPLSQAEIDEKLYNLISDDSKLYASLDKKADTLELIEQDSIDEKEEEIKSSPIGNETTGRTPDDFFKKNIKEGKEIGNADNIKEVLKSLNKAKELISNYEVSVHSYEYYSLPSETEDEIKAQISSEDVETFFSSNAVISILLEIKNKELGDDLQKIVLAVFTAKEGKVNWDGIVKGDDDNFYAFTNEGINKLFEKEMRSLQEQKIEGIE